jgi:hypothetical protein
MMEVLENLYLSRMLKLIEQELKKILHGVQFFELIEKEDK